MKFSERTFPVVMIVIDICAAVCYLPGGNWRKVVYWLAAAVLTFVVTF